MHVIEMRPLRARAATLLATRWAPDADAAQLVRLARGNPAHLRQLAAAARAGAELGSASDAVRARFELLDPESRRVLRGASIVGHRFAVAPVAAALGTTPQALEGSGALRRLVDAGLVVPAGFEPSGEARSYEFEAELVRLAAHDLSPPEDRGRAHRAVARWLAATGTAPPGVVGAHLLEAGDAEAAAPFLVDAAQAALAEDQRGGARGAFRAYADLARSCALAGHVLGRLERLEAQVAFWRGEMDGAVHAADRAAAHLVRGTAEWFRTRSVGLTAAGQLGQHAVVDRILREARQARPRGKDAEAAKAVCLCRAATQLAAVGRVLRTSGQAGGAEARAWFARARATLAVTEHRLGDAIDAMVEAHRAHVADGDARAAAQVRVYLGSYYTWTGAWARARECIDDAAQVAERLGADYLSTWARYTRGKLLAETAPFEDAREVLSEVVARTKDGPRMRAGAWIYLACAALRGGAFPEAAAAARSAMDAHDSPATKLPALAALVRAEVATGAPPSPATCARLEQGLREVELVEFDELVRLARVEAHLARGDAAAARDALDDAVKVLHARARSLRTEVRADEYLLLPSVNARIVALREQRSTDVKGRGRARVRARADRRR
jgi:tetratricopeptide (TPR) repeat protein